jgi:hypothetical protein
VKKQGGVAEFGGDLLAAFLDVGHCDPRAIGDKQPCLGFSLPAGRAGDDRHFAAQSSQDFFLASRSSTMDLDPFVLPIPYDLGMSSGILKVKRSARLPWPLAQGSA